MKLPIHTTLMIMLFGLIFIGQGIATSAMPSSMMVMDGMNMPMQGHMMQEMDHNPEHMKRNSISSDIETSDMDCCFYECKCFVGSCSTALAITKSINVTAFLNLTSKIPTFTSLTLSQELTPLFRPPIYS